LNQFLRSIEPPVFPNRRPDQRHGDNDENGADAAGYDGEHRPKPMRQRARFKPAELFVRRADEQTVHRGDASALLIRSQHLHQRVPDNDAHLNPGEVADTRAIVARLRLEQLPGIHQTADAALAVVADGAVVRRDSAAQGQRGGAAGIRAADGKRDQNLVTPSATAAKIDAMAHATHNLLT